MSSPAEPPPEHIVASYSASYSAPLATYHVLGITADFQWYQAHIDDCWSLVTKLCVYPLIFHRQPQTVVAASCNSIGNHIPFENDASH